MRTRKKIPYAITPSTPNKTTAKAIFKMLIVITGAAGRIGREVVQALSTIHELRLIDKRPVTGASCIVADLAVIPPQRRRRRWLGADGVDWTASFIGADAVLHLAANPDPNASWKEVLRDNIQATWNICEAAAKHHVPRVVFASSNYAVKALEMELAPRCYEVGGPKIGSESPPRPLTAYGLSKATGETIGQAFVAEGKLESFVAVRIGAFAAAPATTEPWKHLWIGVRDICNLMERCIHTELSGFHVVYGVSAQPTSPYDLSHTRRLLNWEPKQKSPYSVSEMPVVAVV